MILTSLKLLKIGFDQVCFGVSDVPEKFNARKVWSHQDVWIVMGDRFEFSIRNHSTQIYAAQHKQRLSMASTVSY